MAETKKENSHVPDANADRSGYVLELARPRGSLAEGTFLTTLTILIFEAHFFIFESFERFASGVPLSTPPQTHLHKSLTSP